MPHARSPHHKRPDERGPLVFDTRALGPGSERSQTLTVSAPAELGAGMVRVPEHGDLDVDLRLAGVSEGVLVTATVTAPLAGECARCLEEFTASMTVSFRELYGQQPGDGEEDGYLLSGDLLDLEPALRDALVLELPLSPLCAEDCRGLCAECGVRLADAEPGHGHPSRGTMWAALQGLVVEDSPARQQEQVPDGHAPGRTSAPDRAR